jgi:TPR repeat protein
MESSHDALCCCETCLGAAAADPNYAIHAVESAAAEVLYRDAIILGIRSRGGSAAVYTGGEGKSGWDTAWSKSGLDADAAALCLAAADQGHAGAQCHLGQAYSTGQGVPQDNEIGRKYFTAAALQGNIEVLGGSTRHQP